jgi:hypothetical protein
MSRPSSRDYTGKFNTWNLNHYYYARLEWSSAQVSLEVTNTNTSVTQSVTIPLVWPPGDPDPRLNLRYLFLGRDNCNSCGQTMTGPIWSDVRLTEYSQCPPPPGCDCMPDEEVEQSCGDCGTQTRICGSDCFWAGSWSACAGPDPGNTCDTGSLGVCADGTQRCVDGFLQCESDNQAGTEVCGDGLDNDCDGVTDNGCPGPDGGTHAVSDGGSQVDSAVSDGGSLADGSGSDAGQQHPAVMGGCACRGAVSPVQAAGNGIIAFLLLLWAGRRIGRSGQD